MQPEINISASKLQHVRSGVTEMKILAWLQPSRYPFGLRLQSGNVYIILQF